MANYSGGVDRNVQRYWPSFSIWWEYLNVRLCNHRNYRLVDFYKLGSVHRAPVATTVILLDLGSLPCLELYHYPSWFRKFGILLDNCELLAVHLPYLNLLPTDQEALRRNLQKQKKDEALSQSGKLITCWRFGLPKQPKGTPNVQLRVYKAAPKHLFKNIWWLSIGIDCLGIAKDQKPAFVPGG